MANDSYFKNYFQAWYEKKYIKASCPTFKNSYFLKSFLTDSSIIPILFLTILLFLCDYFLRFYSYQIFALC